MEPENNTNNINTINIKDQVSYDLYNEAVHRLENSPLDKFGLRYFIDKVQVSNASQTN